MENQFSKEEIKAKFIGLVADKFCVNAEEVLPESNFVANLGADSLDLVEMVMHVEKTFGVPVSDSEAEHFKTVGDVIVFLEERLNVQE